MLYKYKILFKLIKAKLNLIIAILGFSSIDWVTVNENSVNLVFENLKLDIHLIR